MSESKELARERIRPLMRKEARNKRLMDKTIDFLSNPTVERVGNVGALGAGGAAGYAHYKSQPEGVTDPETGEVTGRKKNLIWPALTSAGTAWTLRPGYMARTLKNIQHAKGIEGAETQAPFVKAVGSSVGLTGGSKGTESVLSFMDDMRGAAADVKSTTAALAVDEEGRDINEITSQAYDVLEGMKPQEVPVLDDQGKPMIDAQGNPVTRTVGTFEQLASSLSEGISKGVSDRGKALKEWASANRGALIGGGAGLASLYAIYRVIKARSKEKQRREEAEYTAKLQAKALKSALKERLG
jgi:hypothetical protein